MAGFLWDKESERRRRREQVMKGRETRTGATHVDGRDGGSEEMSKPSDMANVVLGPRKGRKGRAQTDT